MVDAYTQIIVEEFRKHDSFSKRAIEWLAEAKNIGIPPDVREEYVAKSIKRTCVMSMLDSKVPHFAHEILLKAFNEIDWRAAARILFLVEPELN